MLWQHPKVCAMVLKTLSKSLALESWGNLIVNVLPPCVITISSPWSAPNRARIVSDLCEALKIWFTSFLARIIGDTSSIDIGNCLESIRGPPKHFVRKWMLIGGGGGAEVSASGDWTISGADELTGGTATNACRNLNLNSFQMMNYYFYISTL